jgi:hydroxyethylthiazole kinase-like uncharacterized protein yjeF
MASINDQDVQRVKTIPSLPVRKPDSHKGDYGRVLIVAGSRGMSGAAVLTAMGALRAGAGLVKLAVPEGIHPIVAAQNPCFLTHPLPETNEGTLALASKVQILSLADDYDVLVIGPGLGRNAELTELCLWLLMMVKDPTVIDADGINCLRDDTSILNNLTHDVVLTPHPGEFANIAQLQTKDVTSRRLELALMFSQSKHLHLALKGHRTIVTDGQRVYVNETGGPALATGGSGDVLAGMVGALLGQGLETFDAAQLAVYLHGLAGDMAAKKLGDESTLPTDVLDHLPEALASVRERRAL